MHHRLLPAVIVAALLLAGCGDVPGAPGAGGSPGAQGTPDPTGTPGAPDDGEEAATVSCGGSTYDPSELAEAPPASTLPEGPAGAVDDAGEPAFDPSQDWRVVHRDDDRVELVRELDEPLDQGGGDVRTHESRTLERITGSPNIPDGTWLLTSAGPCTQRLVDERGVGETDLTLAEAPSPEATSIDLLVRERACASGQSAEGRIELLELTETAEEVRLRIGVHPPEGEAQTCPSNPPTPFTVELDEPLGDREILDASVVPPRPLEVEGEQ